MLDSTVTESWKEKKYEDLLTARLFETEKVLKLCAFNPTIENLKMAFLQVRGFISVMIYTGKYLQKLEADIQPLLNELEIVIWGDPKDYRVIELRDKYGVLIEETRDGPRAKNGQNIIRELDQAFFIVKQWGYDEGFFAVKPAYRKLGARAIGEAAKG